MQVYILGGFLGAGKTTILMKIADELISRGKKVTVLVNEAGEIGVDGATMQSNGITSVELPSGCICCTLAGTLQEDFVYIKNEYKPDVILIEPTGVALPHKVKEIIEIIENPEVLDIIGIMDVPRFDLFVTHKKDFYLNQLKYSKALVLTKIDLAKDGDIDRIKKWVAEEIPGVELIPVNGKTGENIDRVFAELKP